jgi:esterase/lipase superfamily enzyme
LSPSLVFSTVEDSAAAVAFFEHVNAALASSPNTELLVYVHGANNTVPRASAQASQFRHFTGRRKVVVVFMWPSAGSLLRYLTDVGNAAATVDTFARFVELLAAYTRASKIDVLAYSAGAQVTSPALRGRTPSGTKTPGSAATCSCSSCSICCPTGAGSTRRPPRAESAIGTPVQRD